MFKKKPNIKSLSALRSSDRRKLADAIIQQFKIEIPDLAPADNGGEDHEVQDVAPTLSNGISSLRNSLLPEGSLSARFNTTVGQDLKSVSGTVYVCSVAKEEQRIWWIKVHEKLYPTVYALWHNTNIVPLLHTPDVVLQKMRGGADLMIPGLALGPPFPKYAVKDSVVAVASLELPGVPILVGTCDIDVSVLTNVRGEKGRAVRGFHWEGDEIWTWSSVGKPGEPAPSQLIGWHINADEKQSGVESDRDDKAAKGDDTRKHQEHETIQEPQKGNGVRGDPSTLDLENLNLDGKEISMKEIDEAFYKALLFGVYHHRTNNLSDHHHGLEFPLTSSFVMSNLVLPFLPVFTPSDATSLQMKKSSWKNIKKFIKYLEKQKLLKSKDRNGGETVVVDIDFENQAFTTFVPYKIPSKEPTGSTPHATPDERSDGSDASLRQQLRRVSLYRPKEKLAPLFEAANAGLKSLYSASDIRTVVITYIEREQLVVVNDKRIVKLNPILANVVFDSQNSVDREVLAKGSVPRETLTERVLHMCSPFWAILSGKETIDDVKPKAGSPPKIQVILETRSGNKTMTRFHGLEAYHIAPQPLADELQKVCASSTSVNQLVGSSPKSPVMEVSVQGPQTQAIIKALEKRGINKQWIDVTDKTKGKKR